MNVLIFCSLLLCLSLHWNSISLFSWRSICFCPPPPSLVLLLSPYPFILLSLSSCPSYWSLYSGKIDCWIVTVKDLHISSESIVEEMLRRWSELMFLNHDVVQQSFLSKLPTSPGDECRKDLDHSAFSRHRGNMDQSKPGESQRADWMHHMHTHMTKLWFVKHVAIFIHRFYGGLDEWTTHSRKSAPPLSVHLRRRKRVYTWFFLNSSFNNFNQSSLLSEWSCNHVVNQDYVHTCY